MRTRLALIFVLLATLFAWAQADAGFPASGKKFPNNASGPPPTQQVWYNCSTGFTKSPCTASSTLTDSSRSAINTFVIKINSAAITLPAGASTITVNFYTPISTQQILSTVYVGNAATSGTGNCSGSFCAWDFSAAPTQILFPVSGTDCSSTQANHTFPPAGATRQIFASCPVSYVWPVGHLMLAFDAATGATVTVSETVTAATMIIPQPTGFNTNMYNLWKSGTNINQAATQKKNSGYTAVGASVNGFIGFVQSITAQ